MFQKLGLQIYSVRNYMTDEAGIRDTFRRLARIGYTEIQTAGALCCSVEAYRAAMDDNGFTCIGTHCNLPQDVDDIGEYVKFHQTLGTTRAGIGGFFNIDKLEKLMEFIEKVNRLTANLASCGMQFTYHHHAHEFAKLSDGTRIIDYLLRELDPRVGIVLDTYWLQAGGVSITEWLEKLAGRCDVLHLKDFAVTPGSNNSFITECGNGNINFAEVLKVAEQTGVRHLCVEQDTWPLGFDSVDYCMRKSFEHLAQFMDIQ